MKRLLPWVLASLIIGYFGIIFYANHGIYFSHFDPSYWKGRFDHSQWQLPQSERGIGDDGLYAYGGYILSQGADPAGFNAEMPPLGKYMIGFTIVLFRNGQLYGLITMTIAIGIFFLCAKLLLRDTVRALSATLILALDPLITSQFAITMLESGQLLFLLLLCLGLSQKKYHAVFLGLVFGAFSAIKFPLVSPLICMGIIALIWQKTKRVAPIFLFLAASIVAYLSAYLRYFSLGHTLINWLGVQKWIVNFYLHANLLPNFGSFVTALTTGWIQNFFTRGWERATEWSPVWPFIFLATLSWGLVYWKKYLAITSMMMLAIVLYSVIPFWTRYLVLFLPIFYLVTVAVISSRAKQWFPILIGIIILTNGAASLRILFRTPQTAVNQFLFDWKHGFFQDMYEQVSSDTQQAISREAFHSIGFQTFLDGQIEKVEITSDPVAWSRFRSPQTVPLNITY
ncbi:hypothetical protein HY948_03605, partial [Candidatus Gottesmanbacteria bacterium]|nr:hypothetical protein [Candidatus Gottesmanbacteria bacterium]